MSWESAESVARFTKRKRFTAQRRVLDRRGIVYVPADDGEPLVREGALDGKPAKGRNNGPRFDRIVA